ncbi:PAS domain S-box protein [Enterovibrio sp. ZSDZ42]|uniref:histidine kinase n=1 Tax=Enterovibrio gelatinilyticus TaxID=2899819 RepID=A0ABT5R323_9GAMM|nr:PAS domain S-box protein [Enterovibrio sp. ZSDZ42]MDD1794674.1 PAS domain S-box protein [Enterovibrio sp. ZSDZ42]
MALIVLSFFHHHKTNVNLPSEHIQRIANITAEISLEYISNNDIGELKNLTDKIIEQEKYAFLSIEKSGSVLVHSQLSQDTSGELSTKSAPIGGVNDPSGWVVIGYDDNSASTSEELAEHMLVWGIIAVGVLSIATIYIMMLGVTKPLRQLQSVNSPSRHTSRLKLFFQDDIEATVQMVNAMRNKLDNSYNQLNDSLKHQKHSYSEARQIEEKNAAIYNASHDAIIVANDNDIIIEFSPVAEQIFGWERHEVVGKAMADTIVPARLREAHIKGMRHFLSTGEGPVLNQRIELTAIRRSGREFPIEISISPAKTAQGHIFVSYIRDITQQLKDQTELKIAAHAFESSEAMFISDNHGHIIQTNPAFTHVTGFSDIEVQGEKPRSLTTNPQDAAFHKDIWRKLLASGYWQGELNFRHKEGRSIPVRISITAVKDESEKLTHYVAHFFDLTEQKNTEQIILESQQSAESANKAKSQFLAAMSHEIRTPMNGVLGVLGLLKETPLTDQQQKLVKTARESGELLLAIINDILDFSKMEAGKLSLEKHPFDMYDLFNQTVDIMRPQAQKKNLRLTAKISDNVPKFLNGDGDRIRQLLLNLLSNAVKYTKKGSVTVSLTSNHQSSRYHQLQIDVVDTGVGIDNSHIPILFNEFTMAEDSYNRGHEGSGLGLAICKQIVNLMDGEISVVSEVGKGSVFSVVIDVDTASQDDSIVHTPEPSATHVDIATDIRILMAEDNPANQVVLRTMLEFSGLSVDIVSNGQEAVEAVSSIPYDIVLMDISMPEMDGMEATRRIRALDSDARNVVIVALTAHAIRGDKENFMAVGMDDFVSKPFTRQSILDCLSRWQPKGHIKEARDTLVNDVHVTQTVSDVSRQENQPHSSETPSTSSSHDRVDEVTLTQLVTDTSAEVTPQLISFYISDAQLRVKKIEDSAAIQDYYTLEFEAHTLGSSAASHGNSLLSNLCRNIEQHCLNQHYETALEAASLLTTEATASLTELEKRVQQGFSADANTKAKK